MIDYEKQLAYSAFSSICELLESMSCLSQVKLQITDRQSDMIECNIEADSPLAEYYFPKYDTLRLCEFINYRILSQCKVIEPNCQLAPQSTKLVYLRCYGLTIIFTLQENDDNSFTLRVLLKLQMSDYASFIDYIKECAK